MHNILNEFLNRKICLILRSEDREELMPILQKIICCKWADGNELIDYTPPMPCYLFCEGEKQHYITFSDNFSSLSYETISMELSYFIEHYKDCPKEFRITQEEYEALFKEA